MALINGYYPDTLNFWPSGLLTAELGPLRGSPRVSQWPAALTLAYCHYTIGLLERLDRWTISLQGGRKVYLSDIGGGAQSVISYLEAQAGPRNDRSGDNLYVYIYHIRQSSDCQRRAAVQVQLLFLIRQ
jgi:hypothetical protein